MGFSDGGVQSELVGLGPTEQVPAPVIAKYRAGLFGWDLGGTRLASRVVGRAGL